MSDWELVQNNAEPIRKSISKPISKPTNQPSSSDWEVVTQQPEKESFAEARVLAGPRMATDLFTNLYNTAQNIPEYYQTAKKELPDIINAFRYDPAHASKQAMAGITELGHGLLNFPSGVAEYGANRLNLLPQDIANQIPYQKDISGDINQFFGEPTLPGEEGIRWTGKNALNLLGGLRAARAANPLNLRAKNIMRDVVNAREKNMNTYTKKYNKLWNKSDKAGLSDMSHVAPNIDMNTITSLAIPDDIVGVQEFMQNPVLQNAHAAKSDLLAITRRLKKLPFKDTGERNLYKAANNARKSLDKNMFVDANGVKNTKLQKKYKEISRGYKKEVVPYKNKLINEYVIGEGLPENEIVNALSHGKFKARRGGFFGAHPEMAIRNLLTPSWNKFLGGIGSGILYNQLFGNKEAK